MLKKSLAVGIIFFLVISSVPYSTLSEEISTGTFGGNTLYVGGTGPGNYSRIQDAIDNASDEDAIFVYSETYYENVIVDKSITLTGEDRDTTIINGGGSGNVVYVSADNVNISGFSIENCGSDGIWVQSDWNTFFVNTFTTNHIGILFNCSSNNIIYENDFIDNLDGVAFVGKSRNNLITHCHFINNTGGVCLFGNHRNSQIIYCHFSGNRFDIESDRFTRWNRICYNNFMGNGIVKHWGYGFDIIGVFIINNYNSNYWDDWSGWGPYHVHGFLYWDWHPAKEPYDIPL